MSFILLSILLGLIPEVLYFTLFLTYTKNLKEKRLKLFLLLSIAYCLCITIQNFKILSYVILIVLIYINLKLVYKNKVQIIDVFIIGLAYLWLMILSVVLMNFVNKDFSNYYIVLFVQKVLMFIPFIFKGKFNILYKKYCKSWNRNDKEKRLIKSLTLRNISLILLNSVVFFLNIIIVKIINFQK